jgi:hypothetical protein
VTYYVALAFKRGEDDGGDTVVCDPKAKWLDPYLSDMYHLLLINPDHSWFQ